MNSDGLATGTHHRFTTCLGAVCYRAKNLKTFFTTLT